jgi:hypothetical protein
MAKSKQEIQAEQDLAAAMNKLADGINRFTDPIYMQKIVQDAMRGMASVARSDSLETAIGPMVQAALPVGVRVSDITISLNDEQRKEMAERTFELLKPQMEEFNGFVKNSLMNMPAHRLQTLADKVKGGAKLHLQQKPGCIFIETEEGDGFYLGL